MIHYAVLKGVDMTVMSVHYDLLLFLMFVYYQYVYALKFHVNPLTFVHAVSQLYRIVSEPLVVE